MVGDFRVAWLAVGVFLGAFLGLRVLWFVAGLGLGCFSFGLFSVFVLWGSLFWVFVFGSLSPFLAGVSLLVELFSTSHGSLLSMIMIYLSKKKKFKISTTTHHSKNFTRCMH